MLKQPIFPLDDDDFENKIFYHGTSDALNIHELLPADETGVLRDSGRQHMVNKVFFTDRLDVAKRYAFKAVERFGGRPIVYAVLPVGDVWNVRDVEFVSDKAMIVEPEVWRGE